MENEETKTPESNPTDPTPKKKMPRWMKIAGGISAVAIVAVAVVAAVILKK